MAKTTQEEDKFTLVAIRRDVLSDLRVRMALEARHFGTKCTMRDFVSDAVEEAMKRKKSPSR